MIGNQIAFLRAECEVIFYTLGPETWDREEAEKLTAIMMKHGLEEKIKVHEEMIVICDELIEGLPSTDVYNRKWERGYIAGKKNSWEARIATHQKEIENLRDKIELLKYI